MKINQIMYQDLSNSGLLEKHNNLKCTAFYSPYMYKKPDFTYVLCGYFPGYSSPIRKIGYSTNVFDRYKAICRQSPYPLFIDYLISAPFDMERSLHKAFRKNRITNKFCSSGETEWFIGISNKEIVSMADELYLNITNQEFGLHKPIEIDYSKYFNPDLERYLNNKIDYGQIVSNFVSSRNNPE